MAPRGVSAEEKRRRLQEVFHQRADVFSLKEVEKIASKEKGIVVQSVKEVLQSLIDDGLVDTDKIGSGVYFWAFPSKSGQKRKVRLDTLNAELQQKKCEHDQLTAERDQLLQGRQDTRERQDALSRLRELEQHNAELQATLRAAQCGDPAQVARLREETNTAIEASNRWAENIDVVRQWVQEKAGVSVSDFNKQFGIPELEELDNDKLLAPSVKRKK